jgi:hypothetical protein
MQDVGYLANTGSGRIGLGGLAIMILEKQKLLGLSMDKRARVN